MATNYFYFSDIEKEEIINSYVNIIESNNLNEETLPFDIQRSYNLKQDIYSYLLEHKSIALDGFVNFRLSNYMNFLDNIVDLAVNKYLIEKEYLEFINLLKLYVSSKPGKTDIIHLIYEKNIATLADKYKEVIHPNLDNLKYLSDITFSSNDYALNTLLHLLPDKIYIHLIDNMADEFINTLLSVFENKVTICTDCDICSAYRHYTIKDGTMFQE